MSKNDLEYLLKHSHKAVLFDLDGTLLDTRDMILASFRHAIAEVLGKDALPSDNDILSLVGIPLADQMRRFAPEHEAQLLKTYRAHNAQIHDSMLRGFEGTETALCELKREGLRMAVITSKQHESAMRGLEGMKLTSFFEFVIGSDDCAKHKPHPGPLLAAAERMGLAPSACAYVGDSPFDMEAAQAAGMYAVGALWGMFTADELLNAGAAILATQIGELPRTLR
jgi:pyrophosphatase PpaX